MLAFVAAAALAALAAPVAATDYVGGWVPTTPPQQQCVNICVNSKATPTCLTGDPACLARKQRPSDFDWMVLEQLFVPQFCRDLLKGVDSTISHQNVQAFPNGVTCKPDVVESELTIHGLWPNYNDGFLGCCNATDTLANQPYAPADFAWSHPELLAEMKTKWVDPTQSDEFDTLCEIYNHEFQKHGLCYAAFGDDWDAAAANYFRAALTVAGKLDIGTFVINWLAATTQTTTVATIQSLYAKKVQVFCSNVDGTNQFSAIRSCWAKPLVASATGPFTQIDCAAPTKSAAFIPCDPTQPVTLAPYVAPN